MRILIVDDNESTREMVRLILQRTGHEVVGEAGDGESALKAFKDLRPEVVLLDIIMPGKSGLEVLGEIRAVDPAAKVVMLTAVDQDEVNAQLSKSGAAAIIYKPFSYDDFEKAFKRL
jgi:two-component system chemotaxis response regulator CheY